MSDLFQLPIFPQGALRESVITTVWVGTLVFSILNLRFGWTYSGLVVPGYLLPLIMLKPVTAIVIVVEAIICYYVVVMVAKLPERFGIWCRFFGRDRFFAILLFSVLIRMLFDGWLLPEFGRYLQQNYLPNFNYRADLFSFGTLVVALLANAFWKPGMVRGMFSLTVTTGISYLIIRFLLIPFTNFNITGLEFMYEDFATSFLASPKVYIILLTIAFLASHLNRKYGWEYNGIIIPALFGLIWHQPFKVLFSFVEASLILAVALGVLRLPYVKDMTMEGARKLMLFFNISFALKIILGHVLIRYAPYAQITDFYGFGYLLPTLIAVKIFDKRIPIRLGMATVQVAFAGSVIACIIGFLFTQLPVPGRARSSDVVVVDEAKPFDGSLVEYMNERKVSMYRSLADGAFIPPLMSELASFERAARLLKTYRDDKDDDTLLRAISELKALRFSVTRVENRYLCIHEEVSYRGWGIYVIDLTKPDGGMIEVPAPLDEWGTLETGLALFNRFEANALVIAGAKLRSNPDQSSNVLIRHRTPFHVFHRILSRENVLQVRGYTGAALRRMFKLPTHLSSTRDDLTRKSSIWVKKRLPAGIKLGLFDELNIELDVIWDTAPLRNIQVEDAISGTAELWLNRRDRRFLLSTTLYAAHTVAPKTEVKRIDGFLLDKILKNPTAIARAGTDKYVPPRIEDKLIFDTEVLTPLFEISAKAYDGGMFTKPAQEELGIIYNVCERLGYEAIWYRHNATRQDYFIIKESESSPERRYWGTFVIRLGEATPYLIQVPRPLYDQNSFEFGVRLFERTRARAIVIAGAHRNANLDGGADLLNPDLKGNMLNLFSQSWMRSKGDEAAMIIQCRGLSTDFPDADSVDGLIAFEDGSRGHDDLTPMGKTLYERLTADGVRMQFVNGSSASAGYEVIGNITASYLRQAVAKEFAIVWVGGKLRSSLRQQTADSLLTQVVQAAGVVHSEALLSAAVDSVVQSGISDTPLPADFVMLMNAFADRHDLLVLMEALERFPQLKMNYVIDRNTRLGFLIVRDKANRLMAVCNLTSGRSTDTLNVSRKSMGSDALERFIDGGWLWLTVGGEE